MNHKDELDYYCKDHNKLCCSACLSKIKDKGKGHHHDCNICLLEEVKDEKKNKLNENIKDLEELSNNIENSINELKKLFENITKNKEELKLKISSIFTKLRNTINEREDEILLEVDNIFDKSYFKEDVIKQSEKFPKQIKESLEKGKKLSESWENDERKLNSKINDCIIIENNIKKILEIKDNINACRSNIKKYIFLPETEEEINSYLEKIKKFGQILDRNCFKFREGTNYIVTNNGTVATKNNGGNAYNCTIFGDKEIPKNKISKWKIKLNTETKQSWDILIGIGPDNPNDEKNYYNKCYSFISTQSALILKGSKQIPYFNHSGRLKKGDIVEVTVDRIIGNLSFAVNDVDYGIAFSQIPKEDILYPTVIIYDQNLSVEII